MNVSKTPQPPQCPHHTAGSEDVLTGGLLPLQGKLSGFTFLKPQAWAISQGEVETTQEESPARLVRIQTPGCAEVRQVFVVRPDDEWLGSPLQPVPPLL